MITIENKTKRGAVALQKERTIKKMKGKNKMTYEDVMKKMDGKTFYSESFGGELVTVNGIEVIGKSGRLNVLATKQDVKDLYNDFKEERKGR